MTLLRLTQRAFSPNHRTLFKRTFLTATHSLRSVSPTPTPTPTPTPLTSTHPSTSISTSPVHNINHINTSLSPRHLISNNNVHVRTLKVKASTGMTGVPVVANGVEVLKSLYKEILDMVDKYERENAIAKQYNKNIKLLFSTRLNLINDLVEVEDVENKLRSGQIEELIEQAEDEIYLCKEMNENPEFRLLFEPSEEMLEEWKGYAPPMGAGETFTMLSAAMFEALEDESCWAEIDAELDAEGVPKIPPFKLDKSCFKYYDKVCGYRDEQVESGSQSARVQDIDLKKRIDQRKLS